MKNDKEPTLRTKEEMCLFLRIGGLRHHEIYNDEQGRAYRIDAEL